METVSPIADDSSQGSSKKAGARSSVSYTYFDLNFSLEVAKKIHENAGGACTPDQLAAFLDYKGTKSGTFQTRLSSAKQFGFVRSESGQLVVTDRARQIFAPVLPEDATNAKADAFLSVELFAKIYEKYRGGTIPPKVGLRNLFLNTYGITPDRVEPAVRVLMDSAEQAGFFPNGDQTKLVRPATKSGPRSPSTSDQHPPPPSEQRPSPSGSGTSGSEGPAGVHAAIVGLLRELPPAGSVWPKRGKERFVKAFLATLDFVYPTDHDDESATDTGGKS